MSNSWNVCTICSSSKNKDTQSDSVSIMLLGSQCSVGQDDMMHDYGIDFYIVIFDYAGQGRRGPAGLGQQCGGVDRRKTRCKGARVDCAGPGEGAGAHRDGPEEWQT